MDEKQMTKGREAYRMMDEACNQLVQSGNWQRVGSSDIKLFLDMYVQALLLKMAQTTGEISGDMLTYIARVPARDILKIGQAAPAAGAQHRLQKPLLCGGHAAAFALLRRHGR